MANLYQKFRLATDDFFVNCVRMALAGVAVDVTHERPDQLSFGTAQERVIEAGVLEAAQMAMHEKRRTYALQLLPESDTRARQAAVAVASRIVEETAEANPQYGAMLDAYVNARFGGDPLPVGDDLPTMADYEAVLFAAIEAVVSSGFSPLAGYNAHVDPFAV